MTDPNATFKVSPELVSSKKRSYVLKVKGNSMIDDGIFNDDYVVIEERSDVNNGDIVVALLDNGLATLKRFYKEATRVRLEPANSTMSPIYATNVQVQGRVVGLIRKFTY
jgi:repressor LexA